MIRSTRPVTPPAVRAAIPYALAVLIALVSALLVAYSTPWGLWGYSDSAAYIASARSLAAGQGLRLPDAAGVLHPSVLAPPLYPWLLALGTAAGLDPLDWARALNLILAFLFPAGIALLLGRAAGSPWLAPALSALLVSFPALFANAASAMSEQVFFCLGFAGMLLLISPDENLPPRRLILSAALVGLAALTRYSGAAFIAAAVVMVWLAARPLGQSRRWLKTLCYALGAALPLLLWLTWTLLATRTLGARTFDADLPDLAARWGQFQSHTLAILAAWIPYASRGAGLPILGVSAQVKLFLLLLLEAAAAAWGWRAAPSRLRHLFLSAVLFSLAYLSFLALAYLFASIPPDLIPRIYSPLWPAGCLALVVAGRILALRLAQTAPRWGPALAHSGLLLIVLVHIVYFFPQMSELAELGHREGVGYTARVWRESPVFAQVRAGLSGRMLISDEPALLLLYTGRGAYSWEEWVQGSLQAAAGSPPPGQGQGRLHDLMRSGAALVIFPPRVEEEFGPESRALLRRWTGGLDPLYRAPEAEILLAPGAPAR